MCVCVSVGVWWDIGEQPDKRSAVWDTYASTYVQKHNDIFSELHGEFVETSISSAGIKPVKQTIS